MSIENFRIFDLLKLQFHPEINIIYGLNGQGKTTILEAIYYLSLTKSFRAKNDTISLKNESEFFNIFGEFEDQERREQSTRIYFSKNEGKHAFFNKTKVKLFSEIIGNLPVILLSLDDIELTSGFPTSRRKFLDVLLSQLYPGYLQSLQRYKKCILQKNKLLNSDADKNLYENLSVWNNQIVEYGTLIILHRLKFVEFLNKNICTVYNKISGKTENISIKYNAHLYSLNFMMDKAGIENGLKECLFNYRDTEIKRQTSMIGPHRDDLDFLKDEYSFKTHASQGENKSFLLSLKILESNYIKEISDKKPLVLLDDIFGELDNSRIENLLTLIRNQGQTFITTTHNNKFDQIVNDSKSLIHISGSGAKN
ncbi:MAG: DNA replication/repair protein RecF [Calditrichae bacterium]|nr:DNA replication/repair protein RecF [Calditrichia bacterium]